jgi:peptidoglycan/xylan/chitin deacetylase (PgdA/CDA1 family)
MAIELEKIKSWDGQSGTGADNRGVIDRNFEKVKGELEVNKNGIVKLEDDLNKKTFGNWAINKDDWASVADAVIDVSVVLDRDIRDISIESSRLTGGNFTLAIRYSYWNGSSLLSAGETLSTIVGESEVNQVSFSSLNLAEINITYIKSKLKTTSNATRIYIDEKYIKRDIPDIIKKIEGYLRLQVSYNSILRVDTTSDILPSTFKITRIRNTESAFFYVVVEIDEVQYTFSGDTRLYTGIVKVPISNYIIYINTDGVSLDNNNLSIFIDPLKINQVITGIESLVNAKIIGTGDNIIAELTESNIEDEEIWGSGYINLSGNIDVADNWRYSKKLYHLPAGTYNFKSFVTGNAKHIGMNKRGEINLTVSNYNVNVTLTEDTYVRFSHPISSALSALTVTSGTSAIINQSSVDVVRAGIDAPLTSKALRGFVKDIYINTITPPKLPHPIITFCADDGMSSDEWFIDVLNEKRVKGTFAVPTNSIVEADPIKLTPAQIIELYSNGHDIASHSYSEVNLTTIPLEDVELEMIKSQLFMKQFGIKSTIYVPVQGGTTGDINNIIRRYFSASLITGTREESPNIPPLNPMRIIRRSFDAGVNNTSMIDVCKNDVDLALATKEWLVFITHPGYIEYKFSSEGAQMRRDELGELIDYIKLQKIPILTASSAYEYYKNIIDYKHKTSADQIQIGMNGL